MSACLVCLGPNQRGGLYHARCLRRLFGTARIPETPDIDIARLQSIGHAIAGRTSLPGTQARIPANLSANRQTLHVALGPGRFVLKPQAAPFSELPENELVTSRLAALAGIEAPVCGLLPLADGTPALVIQRADRLPDGRKLRQEDFCQLAGLSPREKLNGTAEICAQLVRAYAGEPLVESLRLFRLLVFCWWTGCGEAHLKTFSLIVGTDGVARLAPPDGLFSSSVASQGDQLTLTVGGKRERLRRSDWEAFGRACGLPPKSIDRVLTQIRGLVDPGVDLVSRSPLTGGRRARFAALLRERAGEL